MGHKERFSYQNCIISLAAAIVILAVCKMYSDFVYLTNDDMFLKAIVSGEITGTPDAHMIYSHYLLGVILSSLYKITTGIPWYGLYLLGTIAVSMALILYRLLSECKNRTQKLIATVLYMFMITLILFRQIGQVQYTVVAGIAGATAIFFALGMDMQANKKKFCREAAVVILLAAWCFLIREKVLFMLLPFAGLMWLSKYLLEKGKKERVILRRFMILPIFLGVLFLLLLFIEGFAYRLPQWQDYQKYNTARETMIDYDGFPDYDTHKQDYEALGISKESYIAASAHYMLAMDEHYTPMAMSQLAALTKQDKKAAQTVGERLKSSVQVFIERNLGYMDRPVNILVYLAYAILIFLVIAAGKYKRFWQIGLLLTARMGVWAYLVYQGRLPDRITQVLYFAELLCVLYLAQMVVKEQRMKKWQVVCPLLLFLVAALYLGIPKMQAVKGDSAGKIYYGTSLAQLKEYCENHPENSYFADMNSVSSFSEGVLNARVYENKNLTTMGSWIPGSPLVQIEFSPEKENQYVIFQKSEEISTQYFMDYLEKRYSNCSLELEETLTTDAGFEFEIWKVRG